MTADERIGELEIRIAFQDKLIADLDALVRQLGVRLDEARREIEKLKQGMRSPELPFGSASEKPPHY